ncbi:MAG TPA: methyltransferase domain-containing protein [Ktedonobacteraceae bacterium]|nr:methyltransferase domain-containing protein [Ktedonobacteraceae bacterium]
MLEDRRHLLDSNYILPKDIQENQRLDLQHHLLKITLGSNYAAPLQADISTILDVGCGTGRWGLDMAEECPQAEVTGLDLELAAPDEQASDASQPDNYIFVQGNVLEGLPFEGGLFDFVHQRLLVTGIPTQQWPKDIQELIRVTKPGGWIEMVEGGTGFINPGPAMQQFIQWWNDASRLRDIDASAVSQLDTLLQQVGLQKVQKKTLCIPAGKWGGPAGELLAEDMLRGFSRLKGFFSNQIQVSTEEFDATIRAMPAEWDTYHMEYEFYVFIGQVPS